MEKTSLFDFLAFMLPGGALASLLYLYIAPLFPFLDTQQIGGFILLPAFISLFYFLGHVISMLGTMAEKRLPKLPDYFESFLNQTDQEIIHRIDKFFILKFGLSAFVSKNHPQENSGLRVDMSKIEQLHTLAFHLLEYNGKLEKVKILQAQQRFFRNTIILFSILLILQLFTTTLYLIKYDCLEWICIPSLVVLGFGILGILLSIKFRAEREKHLMTALGSQLIAHICAQEKEK